MLKETLDCRELALQTVATRATAMCTGISWADTELPSPIAHQHAIGHRASRQEIMEAMKRAPANATLADPPLLLCISVSCWSARDGSNISLSLLSFALSAGAHSRIQSVC